jgi:hypothetical protein
MVYSSIGHMGLRWSGWRPARRKACRALVYMAICAFLTLARRLHPVDAPRLAHGRGDAISACAH